MQKFMNGFTLIELMITVVILSVVLGIGIPSYRQFVERGNRADGTTALLRLATAQERFFITNGTYATAAQMPVAPPAGLGMDGTERGFYALNIAPGAGGIATGYTASATVVGGESQEGDDNCDIFTVNERGQRAAFTDGGADSTDDCWR
ncbi:MAG: type IV pilin protein [Gammaproteobacteria bacterium]